MEVKVKPQNQERVFDHFIKIFNIINAQPLATNFDFTTLQPSHLSWLLLFYTDVLLTLSIPSSILPISRYLHKLSSRTLDRFRKQYNEWILVCKLIEQFTE